jgi:hypothetical protein
MLSKQVDGRGLCPSPTLAAAKLADERIRAGYPLQGGEQCPHLDHRQNRMRAAGNSALWWYTLRHYERENP